MKKILLMVAVAFSAFTMNAQDSNLEVTAGVGMSSVVGSDADTKLALSYKIGLNYEMGISDKFSIIPGIALIDKSFNSDYVEGTVHSYYAEIPVLFAGKLDIKDDMKLVVKAGPYASYGLFGSDIETGYGTFNVFDSEECYKRFDAGVIAGIGIDLETISISLEYSRGITKMMDDIDFYRQAFGITLGYKF